MGIGDTVKYVPNGKPHQLDGRQGTITADNGGGYFEVEFGRLGVLWLANRRNLVLVRAASDKAQIRHE